MLGKRVATGIDQAGADKYIPEVDGLRALAVLSVLGFHLGIQAIPGGYVGVDIFFVISGYLISRIIMRETDDKRFSFGNFYARRFRRILPALLATVLVTAAVFGLYAPPSAVEALGDFSIYALLSISNIQFWLSQSYFDPSGEANPLLHTWSLSVEEQFYLVWPVLLLVLSRFRGLLTWLIAIFVVGLIASEVAVRLDATAAFYLTPFRVFQFALGGIVARLQLNGWRGIVGGAAPVLFLLGLALCVAPVFVYSASTPFPGLFGLVPTAGAALIIAAGSAKPASYILANPVATYIGRISYSLYLVHWPVIVFYRSMVSEEFSQADIGIILLAITALTLALHYLVERPLRVAPLIAPLRMRPATIANVVGSLAVVAISLSFLFTSGWIWRFPGAVIVTQEQLAEERARYWDNRPMSESVPGATDISIIGDSHGIDLYYALYNHGIPNVILHSYPFQCDNVIDAGPEAADGGNTDWAAACPEKFDQILATKYLGYAKVVFISEHWATGDHASLGSVIEKIRDVNPSATIAVVGPKYEFAKSPEAVLLEAKYPTEVNQVAAAYYEPERAAINEELRVAAQEAGAEYIDLYGLMCPTLPCELVTAGTTTYFDKNHWTSAGATLFGGRLIADASYKSVVDRATTPIQPEAVEVAEMTAQSQAAPPEVSSDIAGPSVPPQPIPMLVRVMDPEAVTLTPSGESHSGETVQDVQTDSNSEVRRLRYGIGLVRETDYSVRWNIHPGDTEQLLLVLYDPENEVYGSVTVTKRGDDFSTANVGRVVGSRFTSTTDGWYELSVDFSGLSSQKGAQLLLYPSGYFRAAKGLTENMKITEPEVYQLR